MVPKMSTRLVGFLAVLEMVLETFGVRNILDWEKGPKLARHKSIRL